MNSHTYLLATAQLLQTLHDDSEKSEHQYDSLNLTPNLKTLDETGIEKRPALIRSLHGKPLE